METLESPYHEELTRKAKVLEEFVFSTTDLRGYNYLVSEQAKEFLEKLRALPQANDSDWLTLRCIENMVGVMREKYPDDELFFHPDLD